MTDPYAETQKETRMPAEYGTDTVPAVEREAIWGEPLTRNERDIIERVLHVGEMTETRSWIRHCVAIFDARGEAQ